MEYEWDQPKRLATIDKHGFDFALADLAFAGPHVVGSARSIGGEERWMAVGRLRGLYVTVVFTRRDGTMLSLRLDDDVVEWFKQQGPGYQTRINAVLRAFMLHAGKRQA